MLHKTLVAGKTHIVNLVGYLDGVSGPFWFAAGCSPMIVFFAVLGISCEALVSGHTRSAFLSA